MAVRRSVDWPVLMGAGAPTPVRLPTAARGELGSLLDAFDLLLGPDRADALVHRAIELVHHQIGLTRVAVFLLDAQRRRMLGTWGMDLDGEIVDEHHVMFELYDDELFRRAEIHGEHFMVFDNCPIVVQRKETSEVVGRGWVACTPIRSARARIGMMFNDAGLSGAAVDESKQARAAILCSLLGNLIELARAPGAVHAARSSSSRHPAVESALALLDKDPSLVGKQIAASLGMSTSRLVRLFKAELGVSLVEYRNRLRLERFRSLLAAGGANLLEAAREAGFGSYAQFHRVFRAAHGTAPSELLRAR